MRMNGKETSIHNEIVNTGFSNLNATHGIYLVLSSTQYMI